MTSTDTDSKVQGHTPTPLKHWSIATALDQLSKCDFKCQGGPLRNNEAWRWLTEAAKVGPEFWPGQGVFYEVEAEVAGHKLTKKVHYFIVGCSMESGTESRYWVYSLSDDPPQPWHYGTVQFTGVPAYKLSLVRGEAL